MVVRDLLRLLSKMIEGCKMIENFVSLTREETEQRYILKYRETNL